MPTGTKTPPEKTAGLQPEEKGWLGRYLGSRVPWKTVITTDSGGEVDAEEAYAQLKEFEAAIKRGEDFEGLVNMQMEETRKALTALGIPSKVDKGEDYEGSRNAKDEALKQVRNLIELQKAEMSSATDLEYTVKGSVLGFEKKKKAKKKGDAREEYSEVHHGERTVESKGPTPQQKAALKLVINQLEALTQQLREVGDSEFSPNELMEEIWTPLVREQIISEDQCPSEFSRIIQLWQGANALYKERCKAKAREEEEQFKNIRGALDDLDQALGIAASVTDVVLTALGTGAKSQEILKLVAKCSRAGVNVVSSGLAKDFGSCSGKVGDILEAAVPEPWGKVSSNAFQATVNAGLIAQKLSQRDNKGAAGLLGDAIEQAFKAIGGSIGKKDLFEEIGGWISHGVSSAIESKEVIDLLQAEPIDTKAVLAAIAKLTSSQVKKAVGQMIAKIKQAKEEDAKKEELEKKGLKEGDDEYDKTMKKLKDSQEQESDDWDSALDDLKGLVPDQEEINRQAIEAGADQTNEQLDAEHKNFTKSLGAVMGVGAGVDDDQEDALANLYDIDTLIAQMEADRAQIELLNAIIDAVGGVLTLIVPQLGGVLKAKQFAMNVVAAVRRSQELITFTALVSDAKKATSPQAYALLSQVDELKHQLTSDTIDAALNLGQAICISAAGAADLSGIGAAAGAGLKGAAAGLEAMQQAKDLLYKKFKERKVKRAWQRYRKALDNPEDRIVIIKAIRKNPTLSKYAVAYGALEMNDPFAKEALRQCNLNDAVLANENTNADKVVQFLEVKFADDIQVVGVISTFAPDSGDPLTSDSWVKNKNAAMGKPKSVPGQLLLAADPPTNNIDKTFAAVTSSTDEVDKGDIEEADTYVVWETHVNNLDALATALRAYKPKTTTGVPYDEFQDYLNELAFAAETESKRVAAQIQADKNARLKAANLFQVAIVAATDAVTAIGTARGLVGAVTTARPPQEVIVYCTSGGGKALVDSIKALGTKTPAISHPVELTIQAISFANKRATKAEQAAKGGKEGEAGTQIRGALGSLLDDFDEIEAAFNTAKAAAEESKAKLGVTTTA